MSPATASRDAERSRTTLLDAAEELFAQRGFDGVSVQEVGAAGGLSRGTPSYFFGSKRGLYTAVLERAFAERDRATTAAFAPLLAWRASDGREALRTAIAAATGDYLAFLEEHPAFVRLLSWEALHGGEGLEDARRESRAMRDAFSHVREERGAPASFEVADAVLVLVSLTFSPLAQRDTFLASLGRDLSSARARDRHCALVVDLLMEVLEGAGR